MRRETKGLSARAHTHTHARALCVCASLCVHSGQEEIIVMGKSLTLLTCKMAFKIYIYMCNMARMPIGSGKAFRAGE